MSNCDSRCLLYAATYPGLALFTLLFLYLSFLVYRTVSISKVYNFILWMLICMLVVVIFLVLEITPKTNDKNSLITCGVTDLLASLTTDRKTSIFFNCSSNLVVVSSIVIFSISIFNYLRLCKVWYNPLMTLLLIYFFPSILIGFIAIAILLRLFVFIGDLFYSTPKK